MRKLKVFGSLPSQLSAHIYLFFLAYFAMFAVMKFYNLFPYPSGIANDTYIHVQISITSLNVQI